MSERQKKQLAAPPVALSRNPRRATAGDASSLADAAKKAQMDAIAAVEKSQKEREKRYAGASASSFSSSSSSMSASAAIAAPQQANEMSQRPPAANPKCSDLLKNRFMRSVPETAGLYRHDGNHVQGALRRKIMGLIFAERYALHPPSASASVFEYRRLLDAMAMSFRDEGILFQAFQREIPRYRRAALNLLRKLRSARSNNAVPIGGGVPDPFKDLRKSMKGVCKSTRNKFLKLLTAAAENESTQKAHGADKGAGGNFLNSSAGAQRRNPTLLSQCIDAHELKILVKVAALGMEHQLLSQSFLRHAQEADGIRRDDTVLRSYERMKGMLFEVLQSRQDVALDAVRGATGIANILTVHENTLGAAAGSK